MSEPAVCRHCGYFLDYRIPKAPGEPGWAHTLQTPTKPVGPPCDTPEPHAVHPHDPRPATDGPVVWDSAAPRRPSDLPEFLLARIAEDEAVLTRSEPFPHYSHGYDDVGTYSGTCPTCRQMIWGSHQRVLAECEAKRRIVEFAQQCEADEAFWPNAAVMVARRGATFVTLRLLALPYADHPDYREEWRP